MYLFIMGKIKMREDLTGIVVNKLTVRGLAPKEEWWGRKVKWICDCECGGISHVSTYHIKKKLCKSCFNCRTKTKYCGKISRSVFIQCKWGAKKRHRDFKITQEYMWKLYQEQNGLCALTNIPIFFGETQKEECSGVPTASLDRIDNGIGYIEGNVQWVHKSVNWMKQRFSQKEFIYWCKLVAENFKDKQ